jgi:hypothetical protein
MTTELEAARDILEGSALYVPDHKGDAHLSALALLVSAIEERDGVIQDIIDERKRQDAKWGVQNHPMISEDSSSDDYKELANIYKGICHEKSKRQKATWDSILLEEVMEVFAEDTPERQRAELVQVAAVAVAMIQSIDRGHPVEIVEEEKDCGK